MNASTMNKKPKHVHENERMSAIPETEMLDKPSSEEDKEPIDDTSEHTEAASDASDSIDMKEAKDME